MDVKEILLELRRYRMGLIQTPEQLRFSYLAIIEGAKKLSEKCDDKEVIVFVSTFKLIFVILSKLEMSNMPNPD